MAARRFQKLSKMIRVPLPSSVQLPKKKKNLMKPAGVINFWEVGIFLTSKRTRLKFCHSVASAGISKLIKIILYWNFKISKLR